jgi:metallo-beta-lactamase family protein
MIRLTFHGAIRTVTGSAHLVENDTSRVLLDCGLFQGRRQEAYERNSRFAFDPKSLSALILSHAHIDHCGNIPTLIKQSFGGDIHCTRATADLAPIMLLDAAGIQEKDVEFVNKIRARQGLGPTGPLYTVADAQDSQRAFVGHAYQRGFLPAEGMRVRFQDAGHILGSALTRLDVRDGTRELRICYTGDLGRKDLPILRDPEIVEDADVLIIESTYGGRLHGDINLAEEKLAEAVNQSVQRGGRLLIPAFALERTQEIVFCLHRLRMAKRIPAVPVFVDSPLALDATEVFRAHPECFDDETNDLMRQSEDPFGFHQLTYIHSVEESKRLNTQADPCVIIAGSGMVEHGRILHHLRHSITNPSATLLLVSFQAENTLGRKLRDGLKTVRIFGEEYDVKCKVKVLDEFSAHADHQGIVDWVKAGKGCFKRIFVVHGEEQASYNIAEALSLLNTAEVTVPQPGESYLI